MTRKPPSSALARPTSPVHVGWRALCCGLLLLASNAPGGAESPTSVSVPPPDSNEPITPLPLTVSLDNSRVLLGKRLFNDPQLSGASQIACSTCHQLRGGGDDGRKMPVEVGLRPRQYNTPSVLNASFNPTLTWLGRFSSLEEQAAGDLDRNFPEGEMWPTIIAYLEADADYPDSFEASFEDGLNAANILAALAEFQRSLITPNAPFDRWLRGDTSAISPLAYQGYRLFKDLGCIACHHGVNVGGNLYQRIGVFEEFAPQADAADPPPRELGRYQLTGRERDRFVFRVPSLRNVAVTGPYFHDGRTADLGDAVQQVARYQLGRHLSQDDLAGLTAFLHTLTGQLRGQSLAVDD